MTCLIYQHKKIKKNDVLLEAVKENIRVFEGEKDVPSCTGNDGYKSLEMSTCFLKSAKMFECSRTH